MFKKIILVLFLFISFFSGINVSYAAKNDFTQDEQNLNVGAVKQGENKENLLELIKNTKDNIASKTGEAGLREIFPNIAKTIKNIFYVLVGLYFIVQVLILFFSSNTEEEVTKFKKSIIWISLGVMTMQIAYSFTDVLFDKDIDQNLSALFSEKIIYPAIELLRFMAGFLFLTMAIYAFYRLVTAHGEEEGVKKGKATIIQAIIGFFMVKVVGVLVTYTYGRVSCVSGLKIPRLGEGSAGTNQINNCIDLPDPTGNIELVLKTINWVNSFVGLITLIFIIYAGGLILFSNGDTEKLKKAKTMIIWIIVGVILLVMSYIILNFFFDAQGKGLISK